MKLEDKCKYKKIDLNNLKNQIENGIIKGNRKEDGAKYMPLLSNPVSEQAKEFCRLVADTLWGKGRAKKKQYEAFSEAVGVVIADLFRAYRDGTQHFGFRECGHDSFSGETIGHRIFQNIVKAMNKAGYLETIAGKSLSIGSALFTGKATRFRAKSKLIELAATYGVNAGDWGKNFGAVEHFYKDKYPIVLKSGSIKNNGKKISGRKMSVDRTRIDITECAKTLDLLNSFYSERSIDLPTSYVHRGKTPFMEFRGLYRIFSEGDIPGYDYDRGGRFYAYGGSYQTLSRLDRPALLIDGEPTVELDIGGSQARIMFKLMGHPIDDNVDPYAVPGFDRDVIKLWFAQTMGHSKLHRAWSPDNRIEFSKRIRPGLDLSKVAPIKKVQAAVLKQWPFMADWEKSPVKWGSLHYVESQIIFAAICKLAFEYKIAAYPVHDSLIVKKGHIAEATRVLRECFFESLGVHPALKVK